MVLALGLATAIFEVKAAEPAKELQAEKTEEALLSEASFVFQNGDVPGAIKRYEDLLVKYPRSYEAMVFLGGIYGSIQEFQKEIELCNKAVKINPDLPSAYLNLGNAYGGLQNWTKAKANFMKAYELSLDKNDTSNLRSSAYALSNYFLSAEESNEEAVKWADRCIGYLPESMVAGEKLPNGLLGEFKHDNQALEFLFESAVMNKAGAYANMKDYEKAKGVLEDYLKIRPASKDVMGMLNSLKR